MADNKHKEIGHINEFCPVRGDPECKCKRPHNYRTNCKPKWAGKFKFRRGPKGVSWGKWEAHHILSIKCVNRLPKAKKQQERVLDVLRVTKWCINARRNMLAMPRFGHTIMYYVNILKTAETESDTYIQIRRKKPPPFRNIPQHDFEHISEGGYCTEVDKDIDRVWRKVSEAKKKHKLETADWLVGELNRLSKKWRTTLKKRGKRERGTHKAWNAGRDDGFKYWYLPFSMATKAHVSQRNFPLRWEKRATRKMDMIWDALCDAGDI